MTSATGGTTEKDIRPSRALRIGIVGHTRIDEEKIRPRLALVFEQIVTIAEQAFTAANASALFAGNDRTYRLLSCAAPGADQLAVDTWLSNDLKLPDDVDRCVTFVLPGRLSDYDAHLCAKFNAERKVDHWGRREGGMDARIQGMPRERCSIISVSADATADGSALSPDSNWLAARFLVNHSDVVVAIWSGGRKREDDACREDSCTYRAIELARHTGVPVVCIYTKEPPGNDALAVRNSCHFEQGGIRQAPAGEVSLERELGTLLNPYRSAGHSTRERFVWRLLKAPFRFVANICSMAVGSQRGIGEHGHEVHDAAEEVAFLTRFYHAHATPAGRAIWLAALKRSVADVWKRRAWPLICRGAAKTKPAPEIPEPRADLSARFDTFIGDYKHADDLATDWMNLHRGTFTLIFGLGFCAVMLATIGFIFHSLATSAHAYLGSAGSHAPTGAAALANADAATAAHGHGTPGSPPPTTFPSQAASEGGSKKLAQTLHGLSLFCTCLEFALISGLLLLFVLARSRNWHRRAVDYRRLAEMFRHTQALWLVGRALAPTRRAHLSSNIDPVPWVQWYYQARVRQRDPAAELGDAKPGVGLQFSTDYRQAAAVHLKSAWIDQQVAYHVRSWRRYEFLEEVAEGGIALAFFLVILACLCLIPVKIFGPEGFYTDLAIAVGAFFTVLGPAAAAALHGMSLQTEAERFANASRRMHLTLKSLSDNFLKGRLTPLELESRTTEAANAMMSELEDWYVTYSLRAPPLP